MTQSGANPESSVDLANLPRYSNLPEIEALRVKVSWGLLPEHEGTLAFISEKTVTGAIQSSVSSGRSFALSVDAAEFDPPLFGRASLQNRFHESSRNIFEDELAAFNPQASSQWDGLLHIRAREFGFYSGITDIQEAQEKLGMHHWAAKGIVSRGVLVDVAESRRRRGVEWDPFSGDVIECDEIEAILTEQGTELLPGDILCLRFGWLDAYRELVASGGDISQVEHRFSGVSASDAFVEFLWNHHIAAVCADNPAVESAPGEVSVGSLHRKLIPGLGMPLGELFDFESLAEHLRTQGLYSFLFTAAPLYLRGAASSTANAIAIT